MLIPSKGSGSSSRHASLSRRVNANSQLPFLAVLGIDKLIKKGEC